jgi:hypothetical protein
MSTPESERARDALAGRTEEPPVTVICNVCDREIPYATARAIPAIGFMCPENVEPKCSPQRSLADMVRESIEDQRNQKIRAIEEVIIDARQDLVSTRHAAEKILAIAESTDHEVFPR